MFEAENMKLTREIIDSIVPEHGRTSCDDSNLANFFGGWTGKYNPDTGKKVIVFPRCVRCYLLDHIGKDMDKLEFRVDVSLEWKVSMKGNN